MQPLELAIKYMQAFFGEGSIGSLSELFADNLEFSGPFYTFDNSADYLESLKQDPPLNMHYKLIAEYEDNNSACLIYEFMKPGVSTIMVQRFEIENGKIRKIILIFDARAFA